MILEAERRGDLKPGGLVIEGTAGNTGIGLALVASARGYRTLIVIPDTQSQEKKDMLRLCGAELIEVPALPYSNPNNYQHVTRRLADDLRRNEPNGVLFADQWNNLDNARRMPKPPGRRSGSRRTAPSTASSAPSAPAGRWPAFPRRCAKQQPASSSAAPTPGRGHAQSVHARRSQGERGRLHHRGDRPRPHHPDHRRAEGRACLSDPGRGSRVPIIFDLLEHEGLCLGGSSGINVAGAIRLARELGPGHTIVTVLCDAGTRYQSKLFNPVFLRSKDLPVPAWLERRTEVSVPFETA